MTRHAAGAATTLLLATMIAGCGADRATGPGPAAAARLGLLANPSDSSYVLGTFGDSLTAALLAASQAGATLHILTPQWHRVEPTPGAWDLAAEELTLAVHRQLGFTSFVNLRILDTVARNTPPDLAGLAWDDSALLHRVDVLVDTLASLARRYDVAAVATGNEVDDYFAQHPGEFGAFLGLHRRAVARFHAAAPGVPIGITTTNPIGNPNAHYGDSLNVTSDLVLHTFYPFVHGSLTQKPVSTFDADLEATVARAGGKPVAFQEVGYASHPLVNGTPADQAEAVRRYRAWLARQPRTRVPFASWFLYTDWSSLVLRDLYAYYGIDSPEFGAFLGSLGLRDTLGRAKPAWEAFRAGS